MIKREQLIELGVYNKPHGVNGEISATLDCEQEILSQFTCLISEIDGIFVPFFVEGRRAKTAQTTLLTIDGIENEVGAALLVNKTIYVLKSEYERLSNECDSDEMPLDYFIGFEATLNGVLKGTIVDVDDATANVLFKIERADNKQQLLIPAVDEFVTQIDAEAMKIAFDVPKELLEL